MKNSENRLIAATLCGKIITVTNVQYQLHYHRCCYAIEKQFPLHAGFPYVSGK